jgi:hypothetical protein
MTYRATREAQVSVTSFNPAMTGRARLMSNVTLPFLPQWLSA